MNMLRRLGKCLGVAVICFIILRLAMYVSPEFRLKIYHIRDDVIMAQLFPITSKFWAHRCNDTRKMEEMMTIYDGVELDIIFCPTPEGGAFETSHDPQSAVDHPLDNFFAILGPHKTKIWLDFKNLNETTAHPALQELEKLIATYRIDKNRLILESENYDCLGLFHQQGFYTSYYCPVNDERYLRTAEYRDEYVHLLNKAIQSGHINAISFPAAYYPLVKEARPDVDLLTWHIGHYGWWDFYFDETLKPIMEDEHIKVILVSRHSRYDR